MTFQRIACSDILQNLKSLSQCLGISADAHFGVLLSEDKAFMNATPPHQVRPPNAHILSTRAFLFALERFEIIPSAEAMREQIKASGRPQFSKSLIERQAENGVFRSDIETLVSQPLPSSRVRVSRSFEDWREDAGLVPQNVYAPKIR
jgi:hypothetical protein